MCSITHTYVKIMHFHLVNMPYILLLLSLWGYYTRFFNEPFDLIFIYACFNEYIFEMILVDLLCMIILFILSLNKHLLYHKMANNIRPIYQAINQSKQMQGLIRIFFAYWSLTVSICVNEQGHIRSQYWCVACFTASHDLILDAKVHCQWSFHDKTKILIQHNAFHIVVCIWR